MKIKNKKQVFSVFLSVIASVFLVSLAVYAATTIGTSIDTGGNLVVDGNATTSGTLVVGTSSWNAPTSTLTVIGNSYLNGNATTSGNFVIGVTQWDAPTSTLTVVGRAYFNDSATTSEYLWIGAAGTINHADTVGGDLYVQDDAEIDGSLYVTGTASSTNVIVGGWATTTDLWVGATQAANATTSLVLGDDISTDSAVCIKVMATDNSWVYGYATSASATIGLQRLYWTSTSCE